MLCPKQRDAFPPSQADNPAPPEEIPLLGEIQVTAPPGILARQFPVKVHTVPVSIHKPGQHFFPDDDRLASNVHIFIGEMSLQPLLEPAPVSFRPFFRAFYQGMEMGIVHRNHPNPHAGNFGADGHTVPTKYLVLHRIERNVRPRAVRKDMPDINDRFVHLFFAQDTSTNPFSQKGKRIIMEKGCRMPYIADSSLASSTKTRVFCKSRRYLPIPWLQKRLATR